MQQRLIGAARTPWARRMGPLAAVHPEVLLRTAVEAALERSGLPVADLSMALVACDGPVGAQASNLGRRVMQQLGASPTPAVTVDGQQIGDIALLHLAAGLRGPTLVAAVESTSIVAPGAALVRDYGRPSPSGPAEASWLEDMARAAGLGRGTLDTLAEELRNATEAADLVAVPTSNRSDLGADVPPILEPLGDLLPITSDDGLLTAGHFAGLADGAAAVVVASGGMSGRSIDGTSTWAIDPTELSTRLAAMPARLTAPVIMAEPSVVVHALAAATLDLLEPSGAVTSVIGRGSVPSADGLRCLVDADQEREGGFTLLRRGRAGQFAAATFGPRS